MFELLTRSQAGHVVRDFTRQRHRHYVYVLFRLSGEPFYVGKGVGDRYNNHLNETSSGNRRKQTVINHDGDYLVQFHSFHIDGQEAYLEERRLISQITSTGQRLTNMVPGGEGHAFSKEELARGVNAARKILKDPEHIDRLRQQSLDAAAMPHVREIRSRTMKRLRERPGFVAKMTEARRRRK